MIQKIFLRFVTLFIRIHKNKNPIIGNYKNIIIIVPELSIHVLESAPFIEFIKNHDPFVRQIVIAKKNQVSLLETNPNISEMLVMGNKLANYLKVIIHLLKFETDILIDLNQERKIYTMILLFLLKPKIKIGFVEKGDDRSNVFDFTFCYSRNDKELYLKNNFLKLLSLFDSHIYEKSYFTTCEPKIYLSPKDKIFARDITSNVQEKYKIYVYISAYTRSLNWTKRNWSAFVNQLLEKSNDIYFLINSRLRDIPHHFDIYHVFSKKVLRPLRIKSLRRVGALISQSDLVVTSEPLIYQIANCFKIPTMYLCPNYMNQEMIKSNANKANLIVIPSKTAEVKTIQPEIVVESVMQELLRREGVKAAS